MNDPHKSLLDLYQQLPNRLEAAIAGLSEAQLDLTLDTGWSIRAYVHHVVEGELIWQINLRAILGCNGIEFPFAWYLGQTQDNWADCWSYGKRATGPALSLFRGSTANLVGILQNAPEEAWGHHGRVTWPGKDKENRITIQDIVSMHIRHMDLHTADIQAIRARHGC